MSRKIEEGGNLDKDSMIEERLNEWITILEAQGMNIHYFLNTLKRYLLDRQPYDFHYLGNETMKTHINQLKK